MGGVGRDRWPGSRRRLSITRRIRAFVSHDAGERDGLRRPCTRAFFVHQSVYPPLPVRRYRVTRPFCFLLVLPCARLHSGGVARARNKSKPSDVPPQTVVFFLSSTAAAKYIYIYILYDVCARSRRVFYTCPGPRSLEQTVAHTRHPCYCLFIPSPPPVRCRTRARAPAISNDMHHFTLSGPLRSNAATGVVHGRVVRNRHRKRKKPITGEEEKKNYKHI